MLVLLGFAVVGGVIFTTDSLLTPMVEETSVLQLRSETDGNCPAECRKGNGTMGGNGVCDLKCNTWDCLYDRGDCGYLGFVLYMEAAQKGKWDDGGITDERKRELCGEKNPTTTMVLLRHLVRDNFPARCYSLTEEHCKLLPGTCTWVESKGLEFKHCLDADDKLPQSVFSFMEAKCEDLINVFAVKAKLQASPYNYTEGSLNAIEPQITAYIEAKKSVDETTKLIDVRFKGCVGHDKKGCAAPYCTWVSSTCQIAAS